MKKQKKNEPPENEVQVLLEEKTDTPDDITPEVEKSHAISSRFGIITLIIAIIAVIISINALVKLKEWNIGLKSIQAKMDERFELEQKKLDTLESSVKELGTQQKIFSKHWNYYHATVLPILQEKRPVDLIWQLQKVYVWLKQAELDMRCCGDWDSALLLLKASKEVLNQSKIPQIQPIYALIEENIAELNAVKSVNEEDLLKQIKNITDEVALLPQPQEVSLEQPLPQTDEKKSEATSGWREILHQSWESIKKIVVIRPNNSDNSDNPLPLRRSRQILNEKIFLALQQIQWALLKKDNTLFHWSINEVIDLIQKNAVLIDLQSSQTSACLIHLQKLNQFNLRPTLPDLQPVCQQLKIYVDTLNKMKPRTKVPVSMSSVEPVDNENMEKKI